MVKKCNHCNKDFECDKYRFETAKYCSKNCHNKARETHEVRTCVICGKNFKYYLSIKGGIGKYCSQQCSGKGKRIDGLEKRAKKSCPVCGKKFIISPSGSKIRKNCSMKCYAKSMVGVPTGEFWDTASEKEKLDNLRKRYEKNIKKLINGCWEWQTSPSKKYPVLSRGRNRKDILVHRLSYQLHYGVNPGKLWVLHTCDYPRCSAPSHLFLGSPRDNVIDMHKKKRAVVLRGEKANGSKLTELKVREIKRDIRRGLKLTAIAKIFNISLSSIYDIKDERTWKHINF